MASKSDFISEYRQNVTKFIEALDALLALRREWDALGYSGTMADEDFVGANVGITAAQLTSAVSSTDVLNALFVQGHNTNFYRVKA